MLTDLLTWRGRRLDHPPRFAPAPARSAEEPVMSCRAFPKFASLLAPRASPLLVDFGPAVGSNLEFYSARLGCKLLFFEDLIGEVDQHARAGTTGQLAASLRTRFRHADSTVDGILCWDLFDFLDKASVAALSQQIVRMLRPGGAVLGLFCTSSVARSAYTRFEIVDEKNLRCRTHTGVGGARRALQSRDIIKMFDGLSVSDSFLMRNNTREMLLRRS